MDLLHIITQYYQGEAKHGFWGAVAGGLLLLVSLALWKWAAPLSMLKGLSVPMLVFGLLVGLGGGLSSYNTSKATPSKLALYRTDPNAFLKQEHVKVTQTHQGWRGIQVFWSVLGVAGLLLSLFIRLPFWAGAGLGILALAVLILFFEMYSMRFNDRYYKVIQAAHTEATSIHFRNQIDSAHAGPVAATTARTTRHRDRKHTISANSNRVHDPASAQATQRSATDMDIAVDTIN
ncbi:MAG: hypothetical protein EOP50_20925, partial [Sphingobacteriales bacterium]